MMAPDLQLLREAVDKQELRAIDLQLARYLGKDQPLMFWTSLLLSQQQGENHVCLDLPVMAGQEIKLL